MTTDDFPSAEQSAPALGSVSRGLNLQIGFLGVDSLYVVLEYPYPDVYRMWATHLKNVPDSQLYAGVPFDTMVIRRGGNGYKLSVWDGDARVYLTDQVNDQLSDTSRAGQGMGIMLQLGPKWLRQYGDVVAAKSFITNVYAQLNAFGVRGPEDYRARLNRLDITLDMLGLRVADFSVDEWRNQWVGRASQKSFYDAPRTGQLQGLAIGSSEGAIRFKVYDKVTESEKRGTTRFWRSVWDMGEGEVTPVARFEWSIRCYEANFEHLRYLSDLSFETFLDVLNYVTLKWGRLCIPQPEDSNQSRWPLAPLWVELRRLIEEWSFNYTGMAQRTYDYGIDINPVYLHSLAGWFAGLQARLGLHTYSDAPANFSQALGFLREEGYGITEMNERALKKWAVLSRLWGKPK